MSGFRLQRRAHVLPDVPNPDRHDVSRMGFAHYDGSRRPPLLDEQLVHRHPRGVVASSDVRVLGPAVEELAVVYDVYRPARRVPRGVGIPRLDEFEPPCARHQEDRPSVVQLRPLVEAEIVDRGVPFGRLEEVLPDDVVHGGDAPSSGDETTVPTHAHGPDGERLLDLGDQGAVPVGGDDGIGGLHIGVVEALLQVPLEPAVACRHPLHPRGRAEGLDIIIEYHASLGLLGEGRLGIHGTFGERQLLDPVYYLPTLPEIRRVDPELPADQFEPEVDDLVDGPADPSLRGAHQGRVPELRGKERADVHLGIAVAADEHRGRAGTGEFGGVDEGAGLLLRIELDHKGAAVLPAETVGALADGAQAVLHDAAVELRGLLEEPRSGDHLTSLFNQYEYKVKRKPVWDLSRARGPVSALRVNRRAVYMIFRLFFINGVKNSKNRPEVCRILILL